jgi:xylan 1,4-beta-xylosidase
VGSERVGTMLRKDYWERFDQVRREVPFERIRCHGLLCDDLGLVRIDEYDGEKSLFLNFTYLDEVFDAMLERGVRPFVEVGFMPQALASGTQTVFWWKGNVTPPKDWELWAQTLKGIVSHWFERYGRNEVLSWPIEIWNEPNLDVFWEKADMEGYFRLYEESVRAIKSVDKELRVGGPAICGGADHWIDAFLAFVREKSLPLDFVSRHLYTTKSPSLVSPDFFYQYLNPITVPIEELKGVRERIDRAGFSHLALHITEFNSSYHPQCPIHDTALNAAYLARLLSESGDYAETMSFWTFCDLFEEAGVPRALFHGGFGLLAPGGIPKPTFHLFSFFSRLGNLRVSRDENHVATLRDDGSIAIVAWNAITDKAGATSKQIEIRLPWESGTALVRRTRIHEEQANPRAHWVTMGRPRFPGKADMEYLRQCARPATETNTIEPKGAVIELDVEMRANEVTLMEIRPFRDESGTYLGLNDELIVEAGGAEKSNE